ncbi:MAG: hypothetical protein LBP79_04810 [Clostridiales bacterium]|jgi:hypothetical protein|nr:hypothetical protein [Clostridiales bacterium]
MECGASGKRAARRVADGKRNGSWLESVWIKALNGLLIDKARVRSVVTESIAAARIEAGEEDAPQSDLAAIDADIEAAQARMRELSKDRASRKITAEEYNAASKSVMDELDRLFAERDEIADRRGAGALDKVCGKLISDFIAEGQEQTAFDKDVFTRLVNKVTVKDRDKIIFELRDGTTVKGETDAD